MLKHLGVPTPAEAAKKIFKGEINKIAVAISELSGFSDDEEDEKRDKKLIETDRDVQADYYFYRFKNKEPLAYMGWSYAKRKVARAYMQKEIEQIKEERKKMEV